MSSELCYLSMGELARGVRDRIYSPREVTEAFLRRIEDRNGRTNAFISVTGERALDEAARAEAEVMSCRLRGPLHGVPIALKDMVDVAGVRTTLGSLVFADYVPAADSLEYERLQRAGAILLGKTNTPEFSARGTTDNLLIGPSSTPFDLSRNSGGSSGGSAAAVADFLAAGAVGVDGGGSVRIPAAWCGVYGLAPTYGTVPSAWRPNGFATHAPFITSGPVTRSVADAALMLGVLAGPDGRDVLSLPKGAWDVRALTEGSICGMRIGFSETLGDIPVDAEVVRVVREAVGVLEEAGAIIVPVKVEFPYSQEELSRAWLQMEAVLYAGDAAIMKAAGIDLLGEHRDRMSPRVVQLIEEGKRLDAVTYRGIGIIRTAVGDSFDRLFHDVDLLACPTVGALPVENLSDGETVGPSSIAGVTVDPVIGWTLTYLVNFIGNPAASVPAGVASGGLPVGLQIVGRRFDEARVVLASSVFEKSRPWLPSLLGLAEVR